MLIHSSNLGADWSSPHVRHRRFTDYVTDCRPEWRLLAHLPNPYPFDPRTPDDTSFSDFFVYGRQGSGGVITIPSPAAMRPEHGHGCRVPRKVRSARSG